MCIHIYVVEVKRYGRFFFISDLVIFKNAKSLKKFPFISKMILHAKCISTFFFSVQGITLKNKVVILHSDLILKTKEFEEHFWKSIYCQNQEFQNITNK